MYDRTFIVPLTQLLTQIKDNRGKHLAIVETAQVKYRELAIKELERQLADAKIGRKIRRSLSLTVPQNHLDDYDRIIGLFELVADGGEKTIEITEDEYAQYVRDDWGWKSQFLCSNSTYVPDLNVED